MEINIFFTASFESLHGLLVMSGLKDSSTKVDMLSESENIES